LNEINLAYPSAALTQEDVYHVQVGYLPAHPAPTGDKVKLVRESQIYDHAILGGPEGLITVSGVKYTTALHTAAQVVDLSLRKLGRAYVPCRTSQTTVTSANQMMPANEFQKGHTTANHTDLQAQVIDHLLQIYGADADHVMGHLSEEPAWSKPVAGSESVLGVEVIHGVRCEMAQTLADVVRRRTPLGAVTLPSREAATACAQLMAGELGWSTARQSAEIDALYNSYDVYTRHTSGAV
jgi:glycerol-3-phosphate dehydrogenase